MIFNLSLGLEKQWTQEQFGEKIEVYPTVILAILKIISLRTLSVSEIYPFTFSHTGEISLSEGKKDNQVINVLLYQQDL